MKVIDAKQITWQKLEDGRWDGCTFASDIGLEPGQWPTVLVVQGQQATKLFHMQTLPHPESIREANERGHYYRSDEGIHSVLVAND